MDGYTEKIRQSARRLLQENKVDGVLGFRRGTMPLMRRPTLMHQPDHSNHLHWDSFCAVNLANYLPGRRDRIAVVAKGCDSRNIVLLILENQIRREQLHIIGVPCKGMLDRRRILAKLDGLAPLQVGETAQQLRLQGDGFEEILQRNDYVQENCLICTHRNPVLYDEIVAELIVEHSTVDRYQDIRAIEAMKVDERWNHFHELFRTCIRCYGCRNVCPMCYCPVCFVDESAPQWLGKSTDPTDTKTFHFLRAYHLAGRCTDCGNCERVCPASIKVRQLTKKLEKDIFELYGHEAGVSLDQGPPLDTYRRDDPEEFFK